jgi:hypothetical protein
MSAGVMEDYKLRDLRGKTRKEARAVKVFFFPGTNPARGENGKLHHEKKMERG